MLLRLSLMFLFITLLLGFVYLICLEFGYLHGFQVLLERLAFSLGGRALSFVLCKGLGLDCFGFFAVFLTFTFKVINGFLNSESQDLLLFMDAPAPQPPAEPPAVPEWRQALNLPDNAVAPQPLRSHVERELFAFFNIGRTNTLSEPLFQRYIEPLALEESSVGFCKTLLGRVNSLQEEHWNHGNHRRFRFSSQRDQDRLYSLMWEYPANP